MEVLINTIQSDAAALEYQWLTSIITPELSQISETLLIIKNLLLYNSPQKPDNLKLSQKGPPLKLPFTSRDLLSGILSRDGLFLTNLLLIIKERHFNKYVSKVEISSPYPLNQLVRLVDTIDLALTLLQTEKNLSLLLPSLLDYLSLSKSLLSVSSTLDSIFPAAKISLPNIPPNISLDFYINNSDLCLDLKLLYKIDESPWLDIIDGKSYVDIIRDQIKAGLPVDIDLKPTTKFFFQKRFEPKDYITKCVTYDNMVVIVLEKIEVSSPDPVLLSVKTKLDSLEYLIQGFLQNLNHHSELSESDL